MNENCTLISILDTLLNLLYVQRVSTNNEKEEKDRVNRGAGVYHS